MRRLSCFCCALVLGLLAATSARGETLAEIKERLGGPRAKIVAGVLEPGYPSVGAMLLGPNPDTATMWCSGTLIGCKTFLTAGHCVEGYDANDFIVFLPSGGFFSVAAIHLHPSYDFPVTDVAVLELGASVNGIAPSPLSHSGSPPPQSPGTIVGFGRSGGNAVDYGLKRGGAVETLACPATSFYSGSVCWRFARPLGPPGTNSDTCNGDSGGPLFIDFGAGDVVAGITSGGTSDACNAPDLSYDGDVSQHLAFIEGVGGADLTNTSCGSLPQVGSSSTEVASAAGELTAATPAEIHAFAVKPGTTRLRIALTAAEEVGADVDLYVKQGSTPTTSVYDCRDIGPNQYSYCEINAPAAGTWYVRAHRASGMARYQVTVTTFARDCSEPANDGLVCDDGNACTSNDSCSGGVCAGSAVSNGTGCDDGNECTNVDVCTLGVCGGSAVADGTGCDDGSGCSGPDSCQSGTCSGASPAAMCKQSFVANRSFLMLKDKLPNAGDRLRWQWNRGEETSKEDFGDPTTSTPYSLCIYDESAGAPELVLEQKLPAGTSWKQFSSGFRYRDARLQHGGIYSAVLRKGVDGEARIIVRGKAHPLALPDLPFAQDTKVTVQLVSDTACWEARYRTNLRNDDAQFKARAD